MRTAGVTSTTPGGEWRKCSMRSVNRLERQDCATKPRHCSRNSTRSFGTRNSASTHICWTVRNDRCRPSPRTPDICCGREFVHAGSGTARVVARLMAPEMNTGRGIRTLSREHAAYNPYSYQNGSVWPHDNSLIALGFKRYGFAAEAAAIARGISEAASHFLLNQLPDLYAGIDRATSALPIQYLGAQCPPGLGRGLRLRVVDSDTGHRAGRAEPATLR